MSFIVLFDLIEKYKSSIDNTSTQESKRIIFKEIDKVHDKLNSY